MTTITEHRAKSVLDKVFRFTEGVMSRREWLDMKVANGAVGECVQVENAAARTRIDRDIEYMRSQGWHTCGNRCHPMAKKYDALVEQSRGELTKPEYRIRLGNGRYLVITKTEYDYIAR